MRLAVGLICLLPCLAHAASGAQEPGRLTVESLYHPTLKVTYVEPLPARYTWRPDGTLLEERLEKGSLAELFTVTPGTWTAKPLLNRDQFCAALGAAGVERAAAESAFKGTLTWNHGASAFLATAAKDLYLVTLNGVAHARLLCPLPGAKEAPTFSPDGAQVAYLRGNDLFVTEVATGRETRLTTGGGDNRYNGRLDWVYDEEVFGRGTTKAYWWSPDSRRVAFLSLDETRVPSFTLMDDRTQPQKPVTFRYPKAGDPNPVARLGVAHLDGAVVWMDDPYPGQDTLIVRVGWDPAGKLVASFQDRIQSWLECRRFEGTRSRSLVRENSKAWVEHLGVPRFLKDGGFLWLSARTGYHHLYRYDAQGHERGALTAGPWDVRTLHGVDEKTGRVYFDATQRNPIGLDGYSVNLEGGGLTRLTQAPGSHALTFNATYTAAMDRWSEVNTPGQILFLDQDGRVNHRVGPETSPAFKALALGQVTFQQVNTRDGFPMETMLVLPPDFDAARKYPVFHYVYGGPNAPMVHNAYSRGSLWFQFLAQQGIVTWICDNRSASGKGAASAFGVHRNLGAEELQDQLDGLAWLKAKPWVDGARIALHGYSYGGFFTAYAMTHSKAWKLGMIGAPVVDWRLYDSIYTERYMGLPADNAAGYEASSALKAAAQLHGKVMLIHGTLDDNVHPQNSVQFIDALEKAGFSAPLTVMPGSGHSPRAPQHTWAMYEALWEFMRTRL